MLRLARCSVAHGDLGDGLCTWCGGPLPRRHSRWCSPACMRAFRVNHVWADAREHRILLDGGRCQVCGDSEDLQVHHDPPVERPGGYGHGCQHHQSKLRTLCRSHHMELHREGDVQLSLLAVG